MNKSSAKTLSIWALLAFYIIGSFSPFVALAEEVIETAPVADVTTVAEVAPVVPESSTDEPLVVDPLAEEVTFIDTENTTATGETALVDVATTPADTDTVQVPFVEVAADSVDTAAASQSSADVAVEESPAIAAKSTALALTSSSCPIQTLNGTLRDFKDTHNNFEVLAKNPALYGTAPESQMVTGTLGANQKPVFNVQTISTTTATEFNQWYTDVAGVNQSMAYALHLDDTDADGIYTFNATPFFVVDNLLFGNQGRTHNYHFTYELHNNFKYEADTFFTISADDDVMLYINGKLASTPLMGVHTSATQTITLTPALAATLGITVGNTYSFDLFYAERNTSYAQLAMQTNAIFDNCTPPAPLPTVTLLANGAPTTTIAPGATAQLTWTSTNAVSCSAVPVGAFATGGAVSNTVGLPVTPASTTAYTIECTNSVGDKAMSTATVNVVAGPLAPTASLLANGLDSITIPVGTTAQLTWTSTNATSCTANPVGSFATGGLVASVAPGVTVTPAVTTTYTIDCTDGTTTASDTATVTVVPAGVLPTVTIYPVPAQIPLGQSSTLIWSSANATSCTSTDFTTNSLVTGTALVTPAVTTNYTVSCVNGASAPVTATTTVTVVPTATTPTVTLVATPTIIQQGGSSLLTWTSANATTCTPVGFVGTGIANTVGVAVSPAVTTTYTITCADGAGNVSPVATATVRVIPTADPSVTLTVTPSTVASGQPATITWSSINATACTAAWMTTPAISGTQNVSPTTTTTYSISCSNAAGKTVTTSVFVKVLTATITANPTSITVGASSTLTWSSVNALSCSSADFVVPANAVSGTVVVTPGATQTYTITCVNGTATASPTATVTVNPVSSGGGGGGGGFLLPQTVQNIPSTTTTTTTTSLSNPKNTCPIIRGYWDLGESGMNVKKIQEFLNTYEGENLTVNGIYGTTTWKAVKRFQTKYSSMVLAPWGETEATGFWYKSTSTLANYLLGCNVVHVNLEDRGPLDELYESNKAPKRYLAQKAEITYLEFCKLTNDCGIQSSKRSAVGAVKQDQTNSTTVRSATRSSLPKTGYIDCEKAVAACLKQGYELPQGLTTSIPDDSPWFGRFFGFGAK